MNNFTRRLVQRLALAAMSALTLLPLKGQAHCDTMDGPVVRDARAALEMGDVTPALKWIRPDAEAEIRASFQKTLVVRAKGVEAKEMADQYFFETLVRVHRAGEGAPYTGLKPGGSEVEPGVMMADKALEKGSADQLIKTVLAHADKSIRQRFAETVQARKDKDKSVEAGRIYVEHYVTFIHYIEALVGAVHGAGVEHAH